MHWSISESTEAMRHKAEQVPFLSKLFHGNMN